MPTITYNHDLAPSVFTHYGAGKSHFAHVTVVKTENAMKNDLGIYEQIDENQITATMISQFGHIS